MNRDINSIINKYLSKHPTYKYLIELEQSIKYLDWENFGYNNAISICHQLRINPLRINRTHVIRSKLKK